MKAGFFSVYAYIQSIGSRPEDPPDVQLEKRLFVTASFLILIAAFLWGALYIAYREWIPGCLSIFYSAYTLISLMIIRRTGQMRFFLMTQLLFGLLMPFVHTLLLGGFANSSVVMLWSFMSPLGALFFRVRKVLLRWLAFLALLGMVGLLEPLSLRPNHLPLSLISAFFVLNVGAVSSIVFVILKYFLEQKDEAYRLLSIEQAKAENLLLNILPKEIADLLKNENRTIADSYDGVSILFADLVGFTPLTASMAPVELVGLLNKVFSYFDTLVEKYSVEKIRTIGDNYMVASGVPRPRADHAQALAMMALDMREFIAQMEPVYGRQIQFRIGINSGPVVGGVIGRKKFVYDIWGDAVNVASRMESHGVAGMIQITQNTYQLLQDDFLCEARGTIAIKGRGDMPTWFLVDKIRGKESQ
jgi:adenylate cyclase